MLDSLVRVTRRAVRIRFANGATERGLESTVSTRRRRPPISRTERRLELARPQTPPRPLPGTFRCLPRRSPRFRDESPISLRPRRNDANEEPRPPPAPRTPPLVGTRSTAARRRPTNPPERLARYDSNGVRSEEADGLLREPPIAVNGSVRFPFNDFKFF